MKFEGWNTTANFHDYWMLRREKVRRISPRETLQFSLAHVKNALLLSPGLITEFGFMNCREFLAGFWIPRLNRGMTTGIKKAPCRGPFYGMARLERFELPTARFVAPLLKW